MEKKIFTRFSRNNKWKDVFNFKSFECKFSLYLTLIFLMFALWVKLHENFDVYLSALQKLTLSVAPALIGFLGIIIAGVAIIISVFTRKLIGGIEELNDEKGVIYKVLVSFEFLAFNVGIGIFMFFLIYLILHVPNEILPAIPFYIFLSVIIYYISFIVFYSISLIGNIIRLYYISNIYSDIDQNEKNFFAQVNEVRIDYILNLVLTNKGITKEEFKRNLGTFVDAMGLESEQEIKQYLDKYYE